VMFGNEGSAHHVDHTQQVVTFSADLGNRHVLSQPFATGDLISGQPAVFSLGVGSYAMTRHAMRVAHCGVNQNTNSRQTTQRLNAGQVSICPLCAGCHSHSDVTARFDATCLLADGAGGF
jgi:hypothetical protein